MSEARRWNEDSLAVFVGLFIFALSFGVMFGTDLLGWGVSTRVWTDISRALAPISRNYPGLPGTLSLAFTYFFLLGVLGVAARGLGVKGRRFIAPFTVVFATSYACWILGSYANIAATANQRAAFGITWSLQLTSEAGWILALPAGVIVGRFLPRMANFSQQALRPGWYMKTAVVLLGGLIVCVVTLALGPGSAAPDSRAQLRTAMDEANAFRAIFFVMTFFTMGVASNFKRVAWSVGLGVALLGLFAWLSHAFFRDDLAPAPQQVSASVTPPSHVAADVAFMQQMIHHHAQAIEMVELLKTRTNRADLKLLAQRIEISQNDEIKMMRTWLSDRKAEVPMDHGHGATMVGGQMMPAMPGMLSAAQMAALEKARGPEFDRLFLAGMIQHHEGALAMVADLVKTPGAGEEPVMFDFISHVDSDQRMEIDRMRRMQRTP
jgi:uncharacterized protein (DUF305 family)